MNKIEEGIQTLTGRVVAIPDTVREDFPEFFKSRGYKMGVEVGVYRGEFMEVFAKSGLEIHGVDPWVPYRDFDETLFQDPKRQDFLYAHATRLMEPYENAVIVRKTSMDAVKDYEDESIDFVYIDANHHFRYIAEDLCEWTNKVKKGGIVAGHDYFDAKRFSKKGRWTHFHVKPVVDAFVEGFRISPLYILGEGVQKEGDKRDKVRSWFFIKQ